MTAYTPAVLFLFGFFVSYVFAQAGTDCQIDSDCYKHQTCSFGYCQCQLGFIKNIHHCFKIRHYGQDCVITDQCHDFRMVCEADPDDHRQITRCVCDKYHEWDDELKECAQAKNFTEMVRILQEETKWSEEIEREGKKIFVGLVIAGLAAISLGLLFATFCVIYGCCFRNIERPPPKDDTEKLKAQEVATTGSPEKGSYVVIPTELTPGTSLVR